MKLDNKSIICLFLNTIVSITKIIIHKAKIEREKYWCKYIEKPKNIIEKAIKNIDSTKTDILGVIAY